MSNESAITIFDRTLTPQEVAAIGYALRSFEIGLRRDGLGDDDHGRAMTSGYLARSAEINALLPSVRPPTKTEVADANVNLRPINQYMLEQLSSRARGQEAAITINGIALDHGQAMTMRVAMATEVMMHARVNPAEDLRK